MSYVLIIGATSDLGKALARQYAGSGYDLILAARNSKELESVSNDISVRTSSKVKNVVVDVTDYSHSEVFNDHLLDDVTGAIYVAGYLGSQEKAQTDFVEARKIVEANYLGAISLLMIIANYFEKKNKGFIIGIASVAGERGRQSNYVYGSAKAGLINFLSGLRNRLHKSNVHVMTVIPGFMETKMTEGMNLPSMLTSNTTSVARIIYKHQKNNRNIVYSSMAWFFIMLIIKSIPESIFKKLNI